MVVKKKPFFFRMLFPMGFDKLVDSSSDKICKIAYYFFFTVLIRTNAKKGYIYILIEKKSVSRKVDKFFSFFLSLVIISPFLSNQDG